MQYKQKYKIAKSNFCVLSKLLQTPETIWRFFYTELEGFYKGRKVILKYWFLLSGVGTECRQVDFYIEPLGNLKRQKLICITYPEPTKNTQLRGRRLYYIDYGVCDKLIKTVYGEEGLASILEELTQVSQLVEKENTHK